MADRAISALPTATTLTASDLFVLSQSNQAKNTTWQTIIGYLTTALDGHGGINSITYTPPVSPSLDGTLTITLADSTHYDVTITNGNGVTGVVQHWAVSSSNSTAPSTWYTTLQTMTPTNRYLWNYMTVEMDDGNDINTTPCVAGVYGDTGQAWYMWVRYSGTQPTSDADMGTTPDDWIGLYSGTESDPSNLHYTDFNWFKYKGEKGDTGAAATVTNQSVTYQESSSGTVVPSGSWTTTIPTVTQGNYLWTRTVLTYNSGTTVTSYSVARFGVDGAGSVASVNNQSPDGNGNVSIDASEIPMSDNQSVEAHINTLHKYMTVVGEASFEEEAYDSQISQVVQWYGFTPESGDNTVDVKDGDFIIISFPQAHPWLSTNYSRVGIVTPSGYIYYLITGSEVTGTGEYNTHFAFRFNGTYLIPVDLNGMTEKLAELKTSIHSVAPANKYKYYHVDCVNGSDSNDGITAPLRTLDKLFSLNLNNDLRVYFDAAGTYSTSVQYFSGMSMHLVKADTVTGDVTIDFTSVLPNDAIQFYNCYVHFKSVKITWSTNSFYFDNSGIMAEGTDFVSGKVGFNTSNLFFEGSTAYALDIRESKAKLHNIALTCPSTDGDTLPLYCRDGELLLYGTFAYNTITATNETAMIRILRGYAYIAVTPSTASGHKWGLDLDNCNAKVSDAVLSAFASVASSGNTITGSGILDTQTTPKTIGNTIGQFETEEYTISTSVAVAADTFGNEITYNITKAGYYPVGIVGWRFSGSGSTRLIAARLRLSAQSAGAGTVSMNPYNITDTAATSVSAYASVLWVKI